MGNALRIGGLVVGGAFAAAVAAVAGVVAMVGVILLMLWMQEPSASAYARQQVQTLFLSADKVTRCRAIGGDGEPGEKIWACQVDGKGCVRTFKFLVDHEYGTEPWDGRAAAATENPCGAKSR